jgi:hypothetical protein
MAYEFDTPWSPPLPLLEKVSALFPALTFTLEFREPNMNFKGWAVARGGVIDEHVIGNCFWEISACELDRILAELRPGREVMIYEQAECMPALRVGAGPERLSVWMGGNEIYYVYGFRNDHEVQIAALKDLHELILLCERMVEDPAEFLPD